MPDMVAQWFRIRIRGLGARLWLAYAPIIALMAIYYGAVSLVLVGRDGEIPLELIQGVINVKFMLIPFTLLGALFGYFALIGGTGDRPLVRAGRWIARQPVLEIILIRFLPVVFLMIPFQETYTAIKTNIPEIMPYSWDIFFARIDRLIFMGFDPWTVTHWLLPWSFATRAMDIAYVLWFHFLMACLAAAAVMPLDSRLRLTYLLACFLSWSVGGSLIALMFSSAGPVYYERLFADPVFSPLFDRLAVQDTIYSLFALPTQEKLWNGYIDPDVPGIGISAFPSMHLCIATGMVLFGFRLSRLTGWFLTVFTGVMLIGSVHLGWHYAVDGIAGIALAVLFWRVSERFASLWFDRSASRWPSPSTAGPESSPQRPAI